ncbi:hypothetical protein [Synechococcus phage S-B68]|nr:hypothetical protein [Synechococcus phage S-B68]
MSAVNVDVTKHCAADLLQCAWAPWCSPWSFQHSLLHSFDLLLVSLYFQLQLQFFELLLLSF